MGRQQSSPRGPEVQVPRCEEPVVAAVLRRHRPLPPARVFLSLQSLNVYDSRAAEGCSARFNSTGLMDRKNTEVRSAYPLPIHATCSPPAYVLLSAPNGCDHDHEETIHDRLRGRRPRGLSASIEGGGN